MEKTERYLQSLRSMKFMIDRYEEMRNTTHLDLAYINNSHSIGDRVQSTPKPDKLETTAIKCLEKLRGIARKLTRLKTEYLNARIDIYKHIEKMEDGQCKRFLIDYYIDCMSMKQLDRMYGFTDKSSIYQLKKRAVRKFEKTKNNKKTNRAKRSNHAD